MIFFVLSGYVIAWVADEKERSVADFLCSRLGRLYSVVVPALILVPLLDAIARHFDPELYVLISGSDYWPARLFANALFVQTVWFLEIRYFSDGPIWSLGYEFWYYVLFCISALLPNVHRYKWPLLIALAIFIGPKVALYGLIWLLGVLVYRLHKQWHSLTINPLLPTCIFLTSGLAFVFIYLISGPLQLGSGKLNGFAYDLLVGLVIAANIWSFKYAYPPISFQIGTIRYLASISFSLYLFHYPLLYFFLTVLGLSKLDSFVRVPLLLALTFSSIHLLSFVSEKQKNNWKILIERLVIIGTGLLRVIFYVNPVIK
jgi:peptidoglycan/LPS O-acetylase OafA/YrhL